jgi:hypothetical protein
MSRPAAPKANTEALPREGAPVLRPAAPKANTEAPLREGAPVLRPAAPKANTEALLREGAPVRNPGTSPEVPSAETPSIGTPQRLHQLLWAAALIGCWTLLLDWRDDLAQLRTQAHAAQAQHRREQSALEGTNWAAESARARNIRLAWLSRFVEADTPGLLRVTALDHLKALCEEVKAGCQISLADDPPEPARGDGAPRPPGGIRTVKLKLAMTFIPRTLVRLLQRIEAGDKLYAVDRVFIAGARAEIELRVFGIDSADARKLRSASSVGS